MVDLHTHVLNMLDDGARDLDESLAMLRAMEIDGVRRLAATPHVRDDYPTTPAAMEEGLASVRRAAEEDGIGVEVLPGGEIALDELPRLGADARARFGLGGNPGLLLLETPYYGWPIGLARTAWQLRSAGIVTVLAHPERNAEVQERPELLEDVVRGGVVVQLTAASVDGRLGRRCERCARLLLDRGLAHLLASDAHGPRVREAGLSAARRAVGEPLGGWLTEDVPEALLAGAPLPPRPARRVRRTVVWRRGTPG